MEDTPASQDDLKEPLETDDKSSNDDWTELDQDGYENVLGSGRLRRKILSPGSGSSKPTKGDLVKIKLIAKFQDDIFEDEPEFQFNILEGEVVQALDLIVPLMVIGETDEIIADPDLGYGAFGFPPVCPPNAAITIEVTLLEHVESTSPLDLDLELRRNVGLRKKDRGNFWFNRNDYAKSVQCYRKAVEYFDDEAICIEVPIDRYDLPEELQEIVELRIKTYNNLAQSQLKLEAWDSALASAKLVLKLDPNNEKALFRKAMALKEKGEVELAIGALKRVTRLYKENKLALIELQRLQAKNAQIRIKEEKMSKKMLGLDKYEAEQAERKASRAKWGKTLIMTVVMGSVSILLGGGLAAFNRYWYS